MALGTFTNVVKVNAGNRYIVVGTYTPGTSGASGDAVTAAALQTLGIRKIEQLIFQAGYDSTGANFILPYWQRDTTNGGKVHIGNLVAPHLHSFLVKGGTAAAGTDEINIKATVIGKEAATDATNTGGANGGVQNSTAVGPSTRASAADFSSYACPFILIGR